MTSDTGQPHFESHPVLSVLVDGTHSSGKTTVIEDYVASRELLADDRMDFGTQPGKLYPYRCVVEQIGGITVPVVVVAEAATQYAQMHPDRKLLTSAYNRIDQQAITWSSMEAIKLGAMMAATVAADLQPDREKYVSAVVSDRGPLAGFVYAYQRLPDDNHSIMEINEVVNASDGLMIGESDQTIPLEAWVSYFTEHSDQVLLTDPTDVGLEDNGLREQDESFRDTIAEEMYQSYAQVVGKNKVAMLSGDRQDRASRLAFHLRSLLARRLIAQPYFGLGFHHP